MKPSIIQLNKKRRNLIITWILLFIQIVLLIFSVIQFNSGVSTLGNFSVFFFIASVPNLILLILNLCYLYSKKYYFNLTGIPSVVYFDKEPDDFLNDTFPLIPTMFLVCSILLPIYFLIF